MSCFAEKPSEEKAQSLIEKGALWNGGIFGFKLGYGLDILRRYTSSKDIEEIIETFYLSDKNAMDAIDKYVDIIDRYGVDDNRSMMRCMRKLAIACGMKGRLLLEYEGKVTEV